MSDKKRFPKSDFGKCVGEDVTLYLADAGDLEPMGLPADNGKVVGRLVGVDRPGVWLEPKAWFDAAKEADEPVRHIFLKWDNVLGLSREIEAVEFGDKKQYRGLRPRQ